MASMVLGRTHRASIAAYRSSMDVVHLVGITMENIDFDKLYGYFTISIANKMIIIFVIIIN